MVRSQYAANLTWLEQADDHRLVVGSQARILYADREARRRIASAFNDAVARGLLKVSEGEMPVIQVNGAEKEEELEERKKIFSNRLTKKIN